MTHRAATLLLLAAMACSGTQAPVPAIGTTADITERDLRHRLFLIAHDSMRGRESGSEGDYKAAEYVAAEFKRLGLEPAGENGTYFQAVPFFRVGMDSRSRLSAGGAAILLGRDWIPSSAAALPMTLNDAPVIYAGSLSDTARLVPPDAASGKIAIVLVPPGTQPLLGFMNARYATALVRARVQLDLVAPEALARIRDGRPVLDTSRNARALPGLIISRAAAATILGGDIASIAPGTTGKPLTGWFDFARAPVPFSARNVVAVLRGSDPSMNQQYLALTAHNDHVGFDRAPVDHDSLRAFNRVVRPMGADSPLRPATADEWTRIRGILDSLRRVNPPRLDSIRNGADDDGSGTVSILEVAERLARGTPRPRRSILFISHTGEEDGLVGSRWFTDHSTVPTDSIVAEIDQDMIGRAAADDLPGGFDRPAGTPTYLEVIGAHRLSREFGDTLEAANARQPLPFKFDYTYDAPGHPLQYYCRADHYSYARYGIPAVAFSRGEHLDYHQITDEPQYINYPGLARVSNMVYAAAVAIGNMSHRPRLDAPKPPLNRPCVQ